MNNHSHGRMGEFGRDDDLERALEVASHGQLARLLALGAGGRGAEGGRPLALIGQGSSTRALGPGAGLLEAITGNTEAGGRTEQEGDAVLSTTNVSETFPRANAEKLPAAAPLIDEQGICVTCQHETGSRCPQCGEFCHENCWQEKSCGFCGYAGIKDVAKSQLQKFGGRRPRRLSSAVDVCGRDGRSVDFRLAGLVAFFAGFVCGILLMMGVRL